MNYITDIINTTLKNLSEKNILATPSNFEKEFFKQLNTSDLILEESEEIKDIVSKLTEDEKELINYDIYTFRSLALGLSKRVSNNELRNFLKDFLYFISPSIDMSVKDELNKVCNNLSIKPNELFEKKTLRDLRRLTDLRIKEDRKNFKEKALDVKKLILFLGEYINRFLDEHKITSDEVLEIKDEIQKLKLSKSSRLDLEKFQKELIEKIDSFEKSMNESKLKILKGQTTFNNLFEQIEKLQDELDRAEEEKSIDYLTRVLTRRAFSSEVERYENEYDTFDSNYAVIFYDIDHFKIINDSFGHDCGDFVLKTFASILDNLTRTGDIIARYGGEEFVSLVSYKNHEEVLSYLKRVKNIIYNNKFVYNNYKIDVEFCAGVAFRKNHLSYESTIKKADSLLYEAKKKGRSKIVIESGEIF